MVYIPYENEYNAVVEFFYIPCAIPPQLYVAAAEAAIMVLFWSQREPDAKELYHVTKGVTVYHDIKHGLLEAAHIPSDQVHPTTRAVFQLGALADIASWYGFIGGVVGNGVLAWTSQIFKHVNCLDQGNPKFGQGFNPYGAIRGQGQWDEVPFECAPPSIFAPVWPGPTAIVYPDKYGFVAASLGFEHLDGSSAGAATRVIDLASGIVHQTYTAEQDPDTGDYGRNHVWYGAKNETGLTQLLTVQSSGQEPEYPYELFPTPASTCFGYGDN